MKLNSMKEINDQYNYMLHKRWNEHVWETQKTLAFEWVGQKLQYSHQSKKTTLTQPSIEAARQWITFQHTGAISIVSQVRKLSSLQPRINNSIKWKEIQFGNTAVIIEKCNITVDLTKIIQGWYCK